MYVCMYFAHKTCIINIEPTLSLCVCVCWPTLKVIHIPFFYLHPFIHSFIHLFIRLLTARSLVHFDTKNYMQNALVCSLCTRSVCSRHQRIHGKICAIFIPRPLGLFDRSSGTVMSLFQIHFYAKTSTYTYYYYFT